MRRVFVYIVFLLFINLSLLAQINYSFTSFSYDDGLVDNYVESIYEDSRGFIWIGTRAGLNRFDGHTYRTVKLPRTIRHEVQDVGGHYVTSLVEDSSHVLWIGTLAGLYAYDIYEDTFRIYDFIPGDSTSLSFSLIDEIVVDKDNTVWIATRDGLNRYNRDEDDFTRFTHDQLDSTSLSNNYIESIMVDSQNQIWIGTLNGTLDKLNADGKTFSHFDAKNTDVNMSVIRDMYEDSNNDLWVVSAGNGVFFRKNGQEEFEHVFIQESRENPIFFSALSSISEDIFGNVWLSSHMGGIAIYDPHTERIEYYSEESPAPHSISGNSVKLVYKDSYNNMWIATHGGGVSMFSPLTTYVSYYCKSPYPNSIPGNIVSSFYEDMQGNMWIGTDGGGLSKFNPRMQTFTNFGEEHGLHSEAILDIYQLQQNVFAVATWNAGLHLFNTRTKRFTQKLFNAGSTRETVQSVYGLYFDSVRNLLWCNTYGYGIQMFNLQTMSFLDSTKLESIFPYWNSSLYSSKLLFDTYDNVWFVDGIRTGKANKDSVYFYDSLDSTDACHEGFFTTDIISSSRKTVYIAKYNGMRTYNPKTGCLEEFFPNNPELFDVKSLVEDAYGNIWIATGKNLLKYVIADSTVNNISRNWGMPQMQYNTQAAYRSSTGHLYFGGLNGFVILHEDSVYSYKLNAPVYFTKLFVNNIEQKENTPESIIDKDFSLIQSITLEHYQSSISIEFAVLNYIDNDKSKCAYILEGFDSDWIYAENTRKATYTNIPPGEYRFCLKTTQSDNSWGDEVHTLDIVVLPPWWKTIWFKTLMVLLSIFCVGMFIYLRDKSIRDQNKKLARLIDEKTQELQDTNTVLKEQNETIQQHLENVREQQLLIGIKNEQLQEALNTKNKLITVIAHDFKNPLSTLLGFVKLLQEKIRKADFKELIPNITSVTKSTEAIYSQMVEVLDWSLSKDEAVMYNPEEVDLQEVADTVVSLISESLTHKNIQFSSEYHFESYAYVDPRMMSAIFRNLIINSIKFTPQNGHITLRIIEKAQKIEIQVQDTGIGMEQEVIDKILSENIVLSGSFQSGFGLQLCKTFIGSNKGKLAITSIPNKGSIFYITVPKGNKMEYAVTHKDTSEQLVSSDVEIEDINRCMLVIDDNPEIVAYLKEIFSDSFTVFVAYDGSDGLEKALKTIPEIIISDIRMPGMDGKVLCQKIKSNHLTKHIPVILVSAQKLPQEQIEGFEHGADDYITKPFNVDILKQKVFALLKSREQLLSHFKEKMQTDDSFELPYSFEDKIIKDITNCVFDNLGNPDFKVDILAQVVGLSRSQLYRKMVSVVGQSPIEYIKTLRLQRSLEMLKTNKYRIAEIAYEVGFSDPGYFSSCFVERYGVKPSEYAKKM
ncbi:MAG: response regulator [Bacteroidales bacterium]|nr:response regulator [Bacteroidales bacterium]